MIAEAEELQTPEIPPLPLCRKVIEFFLLRSLHAETVEFPVVYAPEKCVPFIRRESQNRTFGFPAVTDPDLAVG
jgi:hypothetical protein